MTTVSDGREGEEKRREEKSVVLQCSTTNNKQQTTVTSIILFGRKMSLRLPKELWMAFKEIARRERKSCSELTLDALREYSHTHWKGNEQLLMPSYLNPEEGPSPHHVQCRYVRGITRDDRILCSLKEVEGLWINGVQCYSCKFNKLRKKKGEKP